MLINFHQRFEYDINSLSSILISLIYYSQVVELLGRDIKCMAHVLLEYQRPPRLVLKLEIITI